MPDSVGGGGFPRNINIGHEHLNLTDGLTYQYQGGVPTNVLNWKIIGGVTNVDPSTVGWSSAQLGAIWYNSQDNVYKYWNGTSIQVLSFGQTTLYPFNTTVELQDDFMTGGTGDGSIGALGWGSGGIVTPIPGQSNRPGIYNFSTGAVLGTIARINMSGGQPLSLADTHRVTWVYRLSTNDANTTYRIGSSSSWVGLPPVHGIYLEKLDGDTNWFCVTRASGVQTRIDTTVAIDTNFHQFTYTRNSSGVQFSLDNVNVSELIATNIPTSTGGAGAMIVNSAAASKSFDIDYMQISISITR